MDYNSGMVNWFKKWKNYKSQTVQPSIAVSVECCVVYVCLHVWICECTYLPEANVSEAPDDYNTLGSHDTWRPQCMESRQATEFSLRAKSNTCNEYNLGHLALKDARKVMECLGSKEEDEHDDWYDAFTDNIGHFVNLVSTIAVACILLHIIVLLYHHVAMC